MWCCSKYLHSNLINHLISEMSQFTLHNCPLIYFKINWSLRLPIPEFSGSYCILILKTSSFIILKKIMFSRKYFFSSCNGCVLRCLCIQHVRFKRLDLNFRTRFLHFPRLYSEVGYSLCAPIYGKYRLLRYIDKNLIWPTDYRGESGVIIRGFYLSILGYDIFRTLESIESNQPALLYNLGISEPE